MPTKDTTPATAPVNRLHCRRCGRFLPVSYAIHRVRLCDLCDSRLAAGALRSAASTLAFSRSTGVRQSNCDFLNSHLNGPCSRCLARDAHDHSRRVA